MFVPTLETSIIVRLLLLLTIFLSLFLITQRADENCIIPVFVSKILTSLTIKKKCFALTQSCMNVTAFSSFRFLLRSLQPLHEIETNNTTQEM